MRLNEISYEGGIPVDSYGPGFFRIQSQIHEGPLALLPGRAESWAGLGADGAFRPFLDAAGDIDVLFLGTGSDLVPLDPETRAAFDDVQVGVEIMATPVACRTYNVLLSEGRRIAAALMPV
ncbi:Mth938-like domain-containing protein [Oceanomicrobium pacificus]|uniref:Mth938-like domain-containing protein n=1 Tax=Oceanomicrobium pacificus TaxID=2692916 RepID=A0A6B0TWU6_9RHOB|nr:Mth938-like domain-containing protein [Oceanomicrobium pacificus]MXU65634.1 hypothetical protein [Oceanomicrobium pacificus]